MQPLELACTLATWSAVARQPAPLNWYLFAAIALAAGPRVGVDHRPAARA